MRKLEKRRFARGAWWFWVNPRTLLRVAFNFTIIVLSIVCPFPKIKNALLRLTGMKIGKGAFIAMGTVLDIFYPDLIEIGEGAIIGYGCMISAHELINVPGGSELRIGKVRIGAGATIGARCVVLPGVEIGEEAIVSAMSLVNSDIPPRSFCAGVPAKEVVKK